MPRNHSCDFPYRVAQSLLFWSHLALIVRKIRVIGRVRNWKIRVETLEPICGCAGGLGRFLIWGHFSGLASGHPILPDSDPQRTTVLLR